jgi:putative DNA primase/helicase
MIDSASGSDKADSRPTALPFLEDNIPPELKAILNWVLWRFVEDTDPETGEVDWNKPPVNARTGRLASSTKPEAWCPFEEALQAYKRGRFDGLGFVLRWDQDHNLVAIDLDKCRDPDTGEMEEWAREIINTLNSYTEVSPSGRGVRIILRGKLPPTGRKKGKYENYETGRYVTITGHHIEGTPTTIETRQAELEKVHRQVFGSQEDNHAGNGDSNRPQTPLDLDDAEIIRRAGRTKSGAKFRRLWSGDLSGHGSKSEADLALCNYLAFWCGNDPARIDGLFRQSGLFRSKWQRDDYRNRTIGKALRGRTEFYTSPGRGKKKAVAEGNGHGDDTWEAPAGPPREENADSLHLTDLGNARRVVQRHGQDIRFCHPWKRWLLWDGKRWAEDATAEVVRRVKEAQADLYRRTADRIKEIGGGAEDDGEDEGRKRELAVLVKTLRHCLAWEQTKNITACLESMKSEPGVPILTHQMDTDPFLLNVLNGTLDLRTGRLRPHCRTDLITKLAPVEYRPEATCPRWLAFLDKIMDRNQDLITYRQRVAGYSLTGDVSEQCLWFFWGGGANGKSTDLGTMLAMLGDYACQAVSDLLIAKRNESHPTERADLFGRRFVATIETEEGKRIAEALMKQLTGGDPVKARKMRKDFFEFLPTHKIFLAANHKPNVQGTDHGVWRRIKLVPFTVTITDEEKDKALPEKLKAELPGILAWAVRGCLDWQRHGLGEPEEVRQATDAYKAEQDTLQDFITQCCFVNPEVKAPFAELYDAYCRFSGDRLLSPKTFGMRLDEKGYKTVRGHGGARLRKGLGLPSEARQNQGQGATGDAW